jgi:carboxylate-amine ligase
MSLAFTPSSKPLTLGVEIELQVLSSESLLLTPRADEIIAKSNNGKFKKEFFQSTLELVTGVCDDVHAVGADLSASINQAFEEARDLGLTVAATGTHPLADYRERLVTSSERYHQLIDRNQWLTRRMAVYGMHVHLGMRSGDECIAYNNFFIRFIPHILALSASSPFWQGMYTGLASCRPTTYEALPTAGMPYLVGSWKEFESMYDVLIKSDSIESVRDLWWDIRPSPVLGTLEIRCCDQPSNLNEVLAITAFIQLLGHWFDDNRLQWQHDQVRLDPWILRENKWRSLRSGVSANIIVNEKGDRKALSEDIAEWIERVRLYSDRFGYGEYLTALEQTLKYGNSATRQYQVYTNTQDLIEVVKHNVKEFRSGHPDFSYTNSINSRR